LTVWGRGFSTFVFTSLDCPRKMKRRGEIFEFGHGQLLSPLKMCGQSLFCGLSNYLGVGMRSFFFFFEVEWGHEGGKECFY